MLRDIELWDSVQLELPLSMRKELDVITGNISIVTFLF